MRKVLTVAVVAALATACGGGGGSGKGGSNATQSGSVTQTRAPDQSGDVLLTLSWTPNPDAVAGYIVYYGATGDQATTQASDLSGTSNGFNAQAPMVTYNARQDLRLSANDTVCFRLRAYNSARALSGWSDATCTTI